MKQHFIWTFTELQVKLDKMISKNLNILNVSHISDLCEVDSFISDNMIRIFLIETKDKWVK